MSEKTYRAVAHLPIIITGCFSRASAAHEAASILTALLAYPYRGESTVEIRLAVPEDFPAEPLPHVGVRITQAGLIRQPGD